MVLLGMNYIFLYVIITIIMITEVARFLPLPFGCCSSTLIVCSALFCSALLCSALLCHAHIPVGRNEMVFAFQHLPPTHHLPSTRHRVGSSHNTEKTTPTMKKLCFLLTYFTPRSFTKQSGISYEKNGNDIFDLKSSDSFPDFWNISGIINRIDL